MSDIVARLERWNNGRLYGEISDVCQDAATEIERLRAENVNLRRLMQRAVDISKQHDGFKLWAMEPFTAALAQEKPNE